MKKTYQGSCHCGAVRFEADIVLDHVRVCDCSICRRRGALNHRVEEADFRLLTALDDMALYQFNTHTAKDYFAAPVAFCRSGDRERRPMSGPSMSDAWTMSISTPFPSNAFSEAGCHSPR
jgi:hypothetical protein